MDDDSFSFISEFFEGTKIGIGFLPLFSIEFGVLIIYNITKVKTPKKNIMESYLRNDIITI